MYLFFQVDFRYWGLQSKVERFIHDYGLRRVMLRAHRQAWAWQDEWVGLTMDDVRRLERETQVCYLHDRIQNNQFMQDHLYINLLLKFILFQC